MAEEQILTILIVFALLLNVLGFIFFALSLKGEKEKTITPTRYEKDYDLPMNQPYPEEEQATPYQFKSIEDQYEEDYEQRFRPVIEEEEDRFPYEPSAPLKPEKEIEAFKEKVYTPEPVEEYEKEQEEENPYQYKPGSSYQPVYEDKGTEEEESNAYQFRYEPQYMTEDELDGTTQEEVEVEETNRPSSFQLDLTKEVDYQDEIRPTEENELDNAPKFEGDYQFKHAYSKEERYKYEYDDYKGFKPSTKEEEEEDEFDYNIDIDKEHEKYYGAQDTSGLNRYELYLQKEDGNEEDDELLAKARRNRVTDEPTGRQMFQPVDLEHVPETPLDKEEREKEETIDIKQFEPKKYENKELFDPVEQKPMDEFDDEAIDRRIEYLMGKMHDPFQEKKKKDPLDEEF